MSLRRIVAASVGALVLGFVILNFENWLEGHGWNDLFTDLEKSVTEMESTTYSWSEFFGAINAFMISDFAIGLAVGALIFAFWDPLSRRSLRLFGRTISTVSPTTLKAPPRGSVALSEKPYSGIDSDLVPKGLSLKVTVGKDGADVTAFLTIRNRSLRTLFVRGEKGLVFEIDNRKPPGRVGGALNSAMPPETEQTTRFGPVRILEAAPGTTGYVTYEVRHGSDKDNLIDILSMRYDFRIINRPANTPASQKLDCEVEEMIGYTKPGL